MPTITQNETPWCTRVEAASYLGFEAVETVDAKLAESPKFLPGKIRFRLMKDGAGRNKVRLWKADVLAMLPPFEE